MASSTIPAPHDAMDCVAHSHGLNDTAGYVVTVTGVGDDGESITRTDVEYVEGGCKYGRALEIVREAREQVRAGAHGRFAIYAVIDTVYASGCRPI
jgi:coenzyme F420-reducing hydrogenase gamma subunit